MGNPTHQQEVGSDGDISTIPSAWRRIRHIRVGVLQDVVKTRRLDMYRRTLIGLAACVCLALTGCSASSATSGSSSTASAAAPSGTLRIFAYSDAFDSAVFSPFLKMYPDVHVEKAEISGDSEAVAKLKSGFAADIVNSCAGPIDQEIANKSLQAIDTSRIKDWDQIYPFFKSISGVTVDGKTYMVPMVGGAYGLVYRPSVFPTPPTSWMDLYTTNKQIATPDDPLTNIITAALALGYKDPANLTSDQLANVQKLLVSQKKHVTSYYQGTAVNTLWQQGNADIVPADVTLVNQLKGQDIAFAPMDPALAWTCGYSIASTATNLDAAYAYLNYALSPLVQTIQAEKFSYLVSNKTSSAQLSAAVRKTTGQDNVANFHGSATFNGPTDMNAWTKLWQTVKAS
jgi:spermidine/putrescine transport system substrate-binding protein